MDDALQEAYLKAFRALGTFKAGSDFGTWLYRITYNACIDELRRLKRTPQATDDLADPASPSPGPEQVVGAAETVRRALATLPPDQRLTVVLVDGEPVAELERGGRSLTTFAGPEHSAGWLPSLFNLVDRGRLRIEIVKVDGVPVHDTPWVEALREAGATLRHRGVTYRRPTHPMARAEVR
jgi:hypothetical protein